jgi:type II secretory ATPase GspE/PulE/Tfp pilus assembly ATPase PilB-like protein
MGVDSNVVTSSLLGVMAQRLVREICWNCKQEYEPPAELLREFFGTPPRDLRWHRGAGCPTCHHTGYKGRIAITELWTPGDEDALLINKGAPFEQVREAALRNSIPMAEDVMRKLREGRTNLEELVRVLPQSAYRALRALSA